MAENRALGVLIPPERLIDGCLETLREEVLPQLKEPSVRGQLYAVLDVLQNLRDRVEDKSAPLEAEVTSAGAALERIAAVLRAEGESDRAEAVAAAASVEGTAAVRAAALREALVAAIDVLYDRPGGVPDAARDALAAHLGPQSLRDLAPLKPSLLAEISKG